MPHPSHRLDLQLVPRGPDAAGRVRQAFAALVERGVISPDGWAAVQRDGFVAGGFARVRADVADRPRLWANQQGGFRASCPSCAASVVRDLHRAIRDTGTPEVRCEACGWIGPIDGVVFRPLAAWGTSALVVHDAQDSGLTDDAETWIGGVLGEWALVWRRP